jgi:phosphate-selective porin OprO/OprP
MKRFLIAVAVMAAGSAALAQEPAPPERPPRFRFVFRERPSFRFGDVLRIDLRVKLQGDHRTFTPPEREPIDGRTVMDRRRFGLQGEFLRDFDYEIEYETKSGETRPWRDVFVNYGPFDAAEIRAGKFKIPFSREQLTGAADLDFIYRSLAASTLAPARDGGVMVHGRLAGRIIEYQAGVFRHDGENARIDGDSFTGRTFAVRTLVSPLRRPGDAEWRELAFGVAVTTSNVREGLHSLDGEALYGEDFFERVYVQGGRLRVGTEVSWTPGPAAVSGEFMHVQDERHGQGLGDLDLPRFIGRGWYVTGTWVLTGEDKSGGITPRRELLRGGFGAIEAAARYEMLRFGSSEHADVPFANPRAANLLGNSDRILTIGLNWYPNRWLKIQANAAREDIEDPDRAPLPGRAVYWTQIFRVQFAM